MKISIITPSYNQAEFIEDTIQSVFNQNYSNYEHIIIDAASTDNTIEILKKHKHLIWVSEKDNGQADAINKGFGKSNGEIIAWLNSDDYYDSNVFEAVVNFFNNNPSANILYGDITFIDNNKNLLNSYKGNNLTFQTVMENPDLLRQPSFFWRRKVIDEFGFLDDKLHLVMDLDFFLRIGKSNEFYYLNKNVSYFRVYENAKTQKYKRKQVLEIIKVFKKNDLKIAPKFKKELLLRFLSSYKMINFLKKIISKNV